MRGDKKQFLTIDEYRVSWDSIKQVSWNIFGKHVLPEEERTKIRDNLIGELGVGGDLNMESSVFYRALRSAIEHTIPREQRLRCRYCENMVMDTELKREGGVFHCCLDICKSDYDAYTCTSLKDMRVSFAKSTTTTYAIPKPHTNRTSSFPELP